MQDNNNSKANLEKSQDNLFKKRHSLAHILMMAVEKHYKGALGAIGPVTENGFYYDIDFTNTTDKDGNIIGKFGIEDLTKIEKEMKKIISQNLDFTRVEITEEEARQIFNKNKYKLEIIDMALLSDNPNLTIYKTGTEKYQWSDLCEGPHIDNTKEIDNESFCLDKVAGAYWRGDEKREMLTRIYGLAFNNKQELEEYKTQIEEAKKRDHRLLGQQLELFTISQEVGSGLPLYLPRGAKLRGLLEKYMQQEAEKANYMYVYTPHIGKSDLFAKSGHLDHYRDGMFAPINMLNLNGEGEIDGKIEQFYLKPMNCPMHHTIYMNRPKSYRDLPYRLFEYGTVYRYEESGTLSGLIRVRGFTQNDAHVYCMPSQLKEVIGEAINRFTKAYNDLGITNYKMRFSLPDFVNDKEKYGEETDEWKQSVTAMRNALDELGVEYFDAIGEAAFYGPKIDIQVKNVNGKEDSLSTIQVDYSIAPKFNLTYTDIDGTDKAPVIIHMALMGSVDRFFAFMTEMNGGKFPFWIAPEQIRILTLNDQMNEYVKEVTNILDSIVLMKPLKYNELRYTIDNRAESLGRKIREATIEKIPLTIIIGPKDQEHKITSIRTDEGEQKVNLKDLKDFIETLAYKNLNK